MRMGVREDEVRYGVGLRPLFLVDDGREWDDNDGMDLEDVLTIVEAQELAYEMGIELSASYIARSAKAGRILNSRKGGGARAPLGSCTSPLLLSG
jgi:hypothetical protein